MTDQNKALGLEIEDLDILLVDDSAHMRLLLQTILRAFGVKDVRHAADGRTGLAEIRAKAPSLIISDWEMAPMNGDEFLQKLRRADNAPFCFIPAIVLTAHSKPSLVRRAFESGASQFLVKPVTPRNLLHRIEWVLADTRPYEQVGDLVRQHMGILGESSVSKAEKELKSANPDLNWELD